MKKIDKPAFSATVEASGKRVLVSAAFLGSKLAIDASLALCKATLTTIPYLAMFAPSAKADIDELKRALEDEMRVAEKS